MDEKIEPPEIDETGLDDELADEALDRPAMVAGSACHEPLRPGHGSVEAGRCASAGTKALSGRIVFNLRRRRAWT